MSVSDGGSKEGGWGRRKDKGCGFRSEWSMSSHVGLVTFDVLDWGTGMGSLGLGP